jgi:hypothetical protein
VHERFSHGNQCAGRRLSRVDVGSVEELTHVLNTVDSVVCVTMPIA